MDGRCVCHTSFSYRAQNNIPSFPTLQSISKTTQNRRLFSSWHCRKSSWSSTVLTIYFHRFGDNYKGAFVGRISIPYVLIIPPTSLLLFPSDTFDPTRHWLFFVDWPSCSPGSFMSPRRKKQLSREFNCKNTSLETWQTNNYYLWSGPYFQTLFTTSHLQQRSTAQKNSSDRPMPNTVALSLLFQGPLLPHHTSLSFPFTYAACGRRRRRRKGPSWNIHVLLSSFYPRGAFFLFLPRGGVKKERE